MPVVVVVNPKGGVGKTTVSTNIAGYFAARGARVMLGDVDKQQSSRQWLADRPAAAGKIVPWETASAGKVKVPKGVTHVVLDTPAGLDGKELKGVLKMATKAVVPLQPSVFDIFATRQFLDELAAHRRSAGVPIGIVGMRVDARTIAADKLHAFVDSLGLPVLGYLRDTQNYIHLAAHGLSLFDLSPGRVARDLEQWQGITAWLDA